MPFRKDIQKYIYKYCANHLPDEDWLENEFNFMVVDIDDFGDVNLEYSDIEMLSFMIDEGE